MAPVTSTVAPVKAWTTDTDRPTPLTTDAEHLVEQPGRAPFAAGHGSAVGLEQGSLFSSCRKAQPVLAPALAPNDGRLQRVHACKRDGHPSGVWVREPLGQAKC